MAKHTETEIHDICADYERAFMMANPGQTMSVRETKPGWYTLDQYGGITGARRSYRLSQIEEMTARLKERIARIEDAARARVVSPRAHVVVAKPARETGGTDFFLTEQNTWVSPWNYSKAKRFPNKNAADLVAMEKNDGLPHRYVVVQPA